MLKKMKKQSNIHNESHECSMVHEHLITDEELPGKNCVLRQCVSCGIEKYRKMSHFKDGLLLRKEGDIQ